MRGEYRFPKWRQLKRDRAVGIKREGRAVEHQFVLAADLIDIDQRQSRLGNSLDADVEPDLGLVAPIRRAIRHDENLGTGLGKTFDDILVVAPIGPCVLADRYAEPHAAIADRARQRA